MEVSEEPTTTSRTLTAEMAMQIGADMLDLTDTKVRALLSATIAQVISPVTAITRVDALPIEEGVSGAPIHRVGVSYTSTDGSSAYVQLVLKQCSEIERRVLDRLQGPARHVPYAKSCMADEKGGSLVCMQDLGERQRPDSLSAIDPGLQRREAQALADIHASNLRAPDLGWLPAADRTYYRWTIEEQFFRWAWDKATATSAFVDRFAPYLDAVEGTAIHIIDEMVALSADPRWTTLVHTDINPSNVLIFEDEPYFIDWDTARRGPLFLDLPHHLSTREQAEVYRLALEQRGVTIEPDEFGTLYRIAARYTGLRYIWWTLEAWHADPTMDVWVEHYQRMITS
jgi:aminoglycoside phosphotransferase (APT) family kinase protein